MLWWDEINYKVCYTSRMAYDKDCGSVRGGHVAVLRDTSFRITSLLYAIL